MPRPRENGRLSPRDRETLRALAAYEAAHPRTCPALRTLADLGNLPMGTVQDCIHHLARRGMVSKDRGRARTLELTEQGRAFLAAA